MNNSTPSVRRTRPFACAISKVVFLLLLIIFVCASHVAAQEAVNNEVPPPIDDSPDDNVPFDDGTICLLAATVAYGVVQPRKKR